MKIARIETHVCHARMRKWVFVKVHTHGAPEKQAASLLGAGGRALHEALAVQYNDGKRWYTINNPFGIFFLPTAPNINSRGGPGRGLEISCQFSG